MATKTKLKMIDLFAGTGAFTYAFQSTGKVECVFANDFVDTSKKIYDINFSHKLTLKDINDIDVSELPSHDILTGGFPCFPAGTKVITENGYRNIEEVVLRDRLLTHRGYYQNILNLQQKIFNGILYKITSKSNTQEILCTPDHPFFVRRKKNKIFMDPQWKNASELSKNDFIGMVINNRNVVPDFIKNRPEHWFVMGYFMGNGWVENFNNKWEIFFTICDNQVERQLSGVLPIRLDMDGFYGFENRKWFNILKNFQRAIPEWIQDSPKNLVQAFLDGYEKSKECKKKNHLTQDQAFGIQRLFLKIGRILIISKKNGIRVLKEPKRISAFIEDNYVWYPLTNIAQEEVRELTVYNFEVENDNTYVVQNTIVHNCQPFSLAGKREGFNDERSNVFWKILEILDYHHPRCLLLENVKNLVGHDDGNTFETIKQNLISRGYYLYYKVLNTAEITCIPQHRERIYIVGLLSPFESFNLDFPERDKREIEEMLEENVLPKYYYNNTSSIWDMLTNEVKDYNIIYQYRRTYVRENKSQECPTLTANMGTGGHNVPIVKDGNGIRKLTPRECFNFQGFPQSYVLPNISDCHLYKLAGNAVSLPVVKLIADRLVKLFN